MKFINLKDGHRYEFNKVRSVNLLRMLIVEAQKNIKGRYEILRLNLNTIKDTDIDELKRILYNYDVKNDIDELIKKNRIYTKNVREKRIKKIKPENRFEKMELEYIKKIVKEGKNVKKS